MKRCVILDDYQNAALSSADWSPLQGRVEIERIGEYLGSEDAVVQRLADAEIVMIMRERTPITASLLARLPKLELLVTSGMRNAAIDLAAAKAQGVMVCGTASSPIPPMELAWGLILGLARRIIPENQAFRDNGPWQSSVGTDLAGARLGIVGLGKIGSKMAGIAKAFGMEALAWSPNLTDERAAAAGVERARSKQELMERSDFVSIHLVLSASTRGLIGADDLRRMKPSAFLINTSRAAIVDEAALITALRENWIAGAGLDVFETEPVPADHPYRRMPHLLATPHLGYVSRSNYHGYFGEGVEDILAWLEGQPVRILSA